MSPEIAGALIGVGSLILGGAAGFLLTRNTKREAIQGRWEQFYHALSAMDGATISDVLKIPEGSRNRATQYVMLCWQLQMVEGVFHSKGLSAASHWDDLANAIRTKYRGDSLAKLALNNEGFDRKFCEELAL